MKLQQKLPHAKVVYCSATGVSELRNLCYMSRLGIWGPNTPFTDFPTFLKTVEKRGMGALEFFAMELKHMGVYIHIISYIYQDNYLMKVLLLKV